MFQPHPAGQPIRNARLDVTLVLVNMQARKAQQHAVFNPNSFRVDNAKVSQQCATVSCAVSVDDALALVLAMNLFPTLLFRVSNRT